MRAPPDAETMISRRFGVAGFFDRSRNDFADHRPHASADERILHGADDDRPPVQLAVRVDDGVFQAGVALRDLQPRPVGFQVDKLQRVGRNQVRVENFVLVVIQKLSQAGTRVDAEMLVALRTDVVILFQVLLPDDLPAAVAFDPQPLGPDGLLARSIQLTGFALEPCHKSSSRYSVSARYSPGTRTAELRTGN